jgi:uncharacterized protein (DUF1778 family)
VAYQPVSLRLTLEEDAALRAGADALGWTASQLVEFAAVEAAHRLGMFDDGEPRRIGAPDWVSHAVHRQESATHRLTISLSPPNYELLRRTAERLEVSPTVFAVGATLRYLAVKQRLLEDNPKLRRIRLPAKWRTA